MSHENMRRVESVLGDELKEGEAAMTPSARLQCEGSEGDARLAVEAGVAWKSELDTLAMVMAVQAWDAGLALRE